MLNLQILDFFDYAIKLDNDVSFVAPFPEPNLALKLASRGAKMMGTHDKWFNDDSRVSQGIKKCVHSYIDLESKRCQTLKANNNPGTKSLLLLKPGGLKASIFWEGNMRATFRAHFVVFWLGLYHAPEVKAMSKYWNNWHPEGMWDYRYRGSRFRIVTFFYLMYICCYVILFRVLFIPCIIS
jgi:hypothetical protein